MTDLSKHRPDFESEFTPERRAALYVEITRERGSGPGGRRSVIIGLGVAAATVTVLALAIPAVIQHVRPDHAPVAQPMTAPTDSPHPETVDMGAETVDDEAEEPSATPSLESAPLTWELGAEVVPDELDVTSVLSSEVGRPVAGRYLHIIERSGGRGSDDDLDHHTVQESYMDADGWIWERRSYAESVSRQVEWYKHEPDPELAQLPPDPGALDAHFRAQTGTNSDDERVFKSVTELLTPFRTPELRSAALRVLANLAVDPQDPGTDKEGTPTNPKVTLNEVVFSDGTTGYRAHFDDPTSRPGDGHSVFIDAEGIIIGAVKDDQQDTSLTRKIALHETVAVLPEQFSRRLGAEQAPFNRVVIDEG
ncbi:hypothetical protein EII34_01650 [Arachnia propionica]|uniref:CU044_5270 family protein n=1 Tax=Arachnia propionica TaxID=1750 RepID=A0A3P1TCM6_9ACTN|nr:hypothetical protein [Arachnia propionica]RRD07212.1 hypothetical protein EII34_01650 [Arachnia propionica]